MHDDWKCVKDVRVDQYSVQPIKDKLIIDSRYLSRNNLLYIRWENSLEVWEFQITDTKRTDQCLPVQSRETFGTFYLSVCEGSSLSVYSGVVLQLIEVKHSISIGEFLEHRWHHFEAFEILRVSFQTIVSLSLLFAFSIHDNTCGVRPTFTRLGVMRPLRSKRHIT